SAAKARSRRPRRSGRMPAASCGGVPVPGSSTSSRDRFVRLLLTRPEEDARPLGERLRAAGHEVLIEPLLKIRYRDAPTLELDGVQALLLTSANGVRALARHSHRRDLPVLAVGDATACAARAAGFSDVRSADGDVHDLEALVVAQLSPQA